MEHIFELPVIYKGEELLLSGRLVTFAYVYKFYIMVGGNELEFERDDNGEFRVILPSGNRDSKIEPELITEIIEVLETVQS